jgi:hypothetical protein
MDREEADAAILQAVRKSKGIVKAAPFLPEDRRKIMDIEADAEERSLMGLGKVINTGVREVLDCSLIYVALNDMGFDWGPHSTLVMKKGRDVVGEEVRDEERIARLSRQKNVWFMHKNFAVYRDKVRFPEDIMKKVCYFEIPSISAGWCNVEDDQLQCRSIIYANPSTPSDTFLKEQYFDALDQQGLGTILIGIQE